MMNSTLNKIYKSVLKFLQPLSSEEVYVTIVKEGVTLLKAKHASLILQQEGEFKVTYSSLPLPSGLRINKHNSLSKVFRDGQISTKPALGPQMILGNLGREDIKSHVLIPLSYPKGTMGVLIIHSPRDEKLTAKQQNDLKLFGLLVSLVIKKTQLYSETKKALEVRDLFISMAAHELRTPITTIHGYMQLLNNKMKEENTPQARWVRDLYVETLRLTSLVNKLLETSRIRAGQLQYDWKECDVRKVIDRSIKNFNFSHPGWKVIFKDESGKKRVLVVGDFGKLLQVVTNVLDNAAKFSSPNTLVSIILKVKVPCLILQVQDKGEGIAKKDLPRVFDGFYKGSQSSQKGMGLGLYLSKSIIEEHHGSIHLHSKVNRGTLVEIRLPIVRLPEGG
ncbi:MAG: Multi-sensor signal transduction histidine kinase [Candidatus Daviesbacteria bacterium GW2011_GWA2_40_9]|uniref:histidine kinase n=1 Tax=Candidatus Daviesbacteria bacterium GW2011_GWA2_40_9 TaxID=1618424 RepID=A0A0G0U372_9BACT|nr:MAG: multi-sensor signal transduction histidine kinase [Candidatus Daviesbacteria bacterium GW2011_GWC1_40_9]KKR83548.1 MAG: Multi-sensor signal transduction histidine kinase [Candidatus Daviesbacteria bacterium GW2011_GWA2_40_9]